jgi:hypothetical protein
MRQKDRYPDASDSVAKLHLLGAARRKPRNPRKAAQGSGPIPAALRSMQSMIWSPLILNGAGIGRSASDSLVMASCLGRANARIID